MFAANGLWDGLAAEEVSLVEEHCLDQEFPKDSTIFFPGEAANALFVVKKGLVKLSYFDEAGEEAILRIFAPGDVFGEIFLGVKKQPFAATALMDSQVAVIARTTFERLLTRIPKLGVNFISLLSRRLIEAESRLGEFSHTWAYERLERVLLNLSRAHGQETRRGRPIDIPHPPASGRHHRGEPRDGEPPPEAPRGAGRPQARGPPPDGGPQGPGLAPGGALHIP